MIFIEYFLFFNLKTRFNKMNNTTDKIKINLSIPIINKIKITDSIISPPFKYVCDLIKSKSNSNIKSNFSSENLRKVSFFNFN